MPARLPAAAPRAADVGELRSELETKRRHVWWAAAAVVVMLGLNLAVGGYAGWFRACRGSDRLAGEQLDARAHHRGMASASESLSSSKQDRPHPRLPHDASSAMRPFESRGTTVSLDPDASAPSRDSAWRAPPDCTRTGSRTRTRSRTRSGNGSRTRNGSGTRIRAPLSLGCLGSSAREAPPSARSVAAARSLQRAVEVAIATVSKQTSLSVQPFNRPTPTNSHLPPTGSLRDPALWRLWRLK